MWPWARCLTSLGHFCRKLITALPLCSNFEGLRIGWGCEWEQTGSILCGAVLRLFSSFSCMWKNGFWTSILTPLCRDLSFHSIPFLSTGERRQGQMLSLRGERGPFAEFQSRFVQGPQTFVKQIGQRWKTDQAPCWRRHCGKCHMPYAHVYVAPCFWKAVWPCSLHFLTPLSNKH